ncbi:MAG: ferredoxin domain-containing protein [Candidatus Omnitrophica bacterium]|nr:ferredoxin domain-containing protein [Candidatus Omnitrophota bacterium]
MSREIFCLSRGIFSFLVSLQWDCFAVVKYRLTKFLTHARLYILCKITYQVQNKKRFLALPGSLLILIGCKSNPAGITYCGFRGHNNCRELSKTKGICAFNSIDLGIAAGSAVSIACLHHADNRIMYSIGKAAIKKGLFKDKSIKQALGIPLSASGKNPFFDR